MTAAMLLLRPEALESAILLRPMLPLSEASPPDGLQSKRVLLIAGSRNPVAGHEQAAQLALLLQAGGATVEHRLLPIGHQLSQGDIVLAREWLESGAG